MSMKAGFWKEPKRVEVCVRNMVRGMSGGDCLKASSLCDPTDRKSSRPLPSLPQSLSRKNRAHNETPPSPFSPLESFEKVPCACACCSTRPECPDSIRENETGAKKGAKMRTKQQRELRWKCIAFALTFPIRRKIHSISSSLLCTLSFFTQIS